MIPWGLWEVQGEPSGDPGEALGPNMHRSRATTRVYRERDRPQGGPGGRICTVLEPQHYFLGSLGAPVGEKRAVLEPQHVFIVNGTDPRRAQGRIYAPFCSPSMISLGVRVRSRCPGGAAEDQDPGRINRPVS